MLDAVGDHMQCERYGLRRGLFLRWFAHDDAREVDGIGDPPPVFLLLKLERDEHWSRACARHLVGRRRPKKLRLERLREGLLECHDGLRNRLVSLGPLLVATLF